MENTLRLVKSQGKLMIALIKNLSFQYKDKIVLNSITWPISSGITALMGPNGAGKTTLFKLISGELEVPTGEIVFSEDSLTDRDKFKRVGYLPQEYNFIGRMRVDETVKHAAWSSGISKYNLDDCVSLALEQVDLSDKSSATTSTLSGGQRQRLAIACTLSSRPQILLLDEPTVGLDPIQRRNLRNLLTKVGEEIPVIFSTHLVDDVAALASSITVLSAGNIAYCGSAEEFTRDSNLEDAYIRAVTST